MAAVSLSDIASEEERRTSGGVAYSSVANHMAMTAGLIISEMAYRQCGWRLASAIQHRHRSAHQWRRRSIRHFVKMRNAP